MATCSDVADLLTIDGNERDDYPKPQGLRNVFLLDRTMQRNRDPTSRLLQLPTELLANIVERLADDHSALANLALVNIECRQLARTRQFGEIRFNYGINSRRLLHHLRKEVTERSASENGATTVSKPAISTCIRHVTVASSPACVQAMHHELYLSTWGEIAASVSQDKRESLERQAREDYTAYRDELLITIATAMTNIEGLTWRDRYAVTPGVFSMLRATPIQHLKLLQVPIQTPLELTGPLWPLRSLHLDIRAAVYQDIGNHELAGFVDSVLRLCAPSLRSVYIGSLSSQFISRQVLSFPHLRTYRMPFGPSIAPAPLSSILAAPLVELELGPGTTRYSSEHMAVLERCEPCERLESLVWSVVDEGNIEAITKFLTKHRQLKKLYIDTSAPKELEQQIMPLLAAGGFDHLTSLSLAWEPFDYRVNQNHDVPPYVATVPVESLTAIGTITSLQQLSLAAAGFGWWRGQWLVDHNALRICLRPLKRLRKLALNRDSYHFQDSAPWVTFERYYIDRRPPLGARGRERERPTLDSDMRWFEAAERRRAEAEEEARREQGDQAHEEHDASNIGMLDVNADDYDRLSQEELWELCHRNFILEEGEKYAAVLPQLSWMYAGQWPMGIRRPDGSSQCSAVPLTDKRENCYPLLRSMFGLPVATSMSI